MDAASSICWLGDDEVTALLAEPQIRDAVRRIAAHPEALSEYANHAVLLGMLHSLHATRALEKMPT